jgi:hypothetical protein
VTSGTGRLGADTTFGGVFPTINQIASADLIVAPSGPLTLQDVSVVTHQLAVRVAVR